LAEAWHVAGFAEGVADANAEREEATRVESAAARHDFEQALEVFAAAEPTELELRVTAKRRPTTRESRNPGLVTLARDPIVRVRRLDDGETIEVYAEQSMVLGAFTANSLKFKLRELDEVE
jgi:hypothetical protein